MSEMIYAPQFMSTLLPCVASGILDFSVLLYLVVLWGLKNKDSSSLCILTSSPSLFPSFPLSLSIFLSVSKWPYLPSTSKRIVSQKWVTMVSQCLCRSPHLARWLDGKRALQAGSEDGGLAQRFSSIREEMLGCILEPMRACCDAWCNLCTDECWQWQGSFWFVHESKTANFLIFSKAQKPHAVCPYGSALMILTAVWLSSWIVNECNKGKLASWHSGGTSFVSKFHLDLLSYHGCQCQAGSTWLFTLRGPWEIGLAGASRYGLEPNFLWLISLATIRATVLISPQALCSLSVCLFFSLSLYTGQQDHMSGKLTTTDILLVSKRKDYALSKCTTMSTTLQS